MVAQTTFLDQFRWENRIVLLFANEKDQPLFLEQIKVVQKAQEGFDERHIEVFYSGDDLVPEQANTAVLSSADSGKIKRRYEIPDVPFYFVLIGKDGGVKFRSTELVDSSKLFAIIDAMPMRRSEMRKQKP